MSTVDAELFRGRRSRGSVVPSGRQLGIALAAGLLWLAAMALMARIPGLMADAAAYREQFRSRREYLAPMALLALALPLLGLAHPLSWRAHGWGPRVRWTLHHRPNAPTIVLLVRLLTWSVVLLVACWLVVKVGASYDLNQNQPPPSICFGPCA